ncbi:MAG: signal peptidase II [Actinobacteria bacterium]|nr:MAG: signal peptidase II [Actinomycetota bacterium]
MTTGTAWARAGLVLAAVLAADQVTKVLVRNALAVGERREILGPLDLVRVNNDGIAFGFLGGGQAVVAIAVAAALVGLIVYFVLNAGRPLVWLPTGLLLGGALGNVFDRLRDGVVTDFLRLPHWPAFNVADMAITAGVIALVFSLDADRGH